MAGRSPDTHELELWWERRGKSSRNAPDNLPIHTRFSIDLISGILCQSHWNLVGSIFLGLDRIHSKRIYFNWLAIENRGKI